MISVSVITRLPALVFLAALLRAVATPGRLALELEHEVALAEVPEQRSVRKSLDVGCDASPGVGLHERHELVGKARHRASDADAAHVRASADTVHPAALGHVALGDRAFAAELDEAALVVAVGRREEALLGETGARAALARGVLKQHGRAQL